MNAQLRSITAIVALSLSAAVAASVYAVDQTSPAVQAERAAPERKELLSIDFPGGPISKLLSQINQTDRVSFNIITVGGPADLATELPPFSLRNTRLDTLAQVIRQLLQPRGLDLLPVGGDDYSFVCTLRRIEPAARDKTQQHQFESYQLGPYLEQQSVDEIVDAMRAAWELDPGHDAAALRLKFHPGTSILLVSGPVDAVQITRRVLVELKRTPEKKPRASEQPKTAPDPKS